ncbi:MAG TPA: translation initiation factor IF-2, partial [Candidatus Paceibacterota bacterium]|nr:translation initiation factor IF-2 [Candidatus Paceibacterota bacterium]
MARKNEVKTSQPVKAGSVREPRPPVVVVVGHVDHGKTTLLDHIRKATVAAREAGGITQAVGAYEIEHNGRRITFIDTPGHEAFSAMRSRGAEVADLAILVVAADEGVKPQTREAIKILENAKTPFVVALNKIDKAGASGVEKAKASLAEAGVLLEGYGGQVSWHGISAKTGEGVDGLLDLILLAADVEELTCDPGAAGSGFILEVRRDPRRGVEVSAIVKDGTLRRGDAIATATAAGKVKILENFAGKAAGELAPSAPALIIGFESLPNVGEAFTVGAFRGAPAAIAGRQISPMAPKNANTLNLILKASDAGSLEALAVVLRGVDQKAGKEVFLVDQSVGDVNDGDVRLASATGSTIIGFKNRVEKGARNLADAQFVEVITSNIVYDLAKAVEEYLTGARGPAAVGELEVLALFNQDKLDKQLIGGRVANGTFRAKATCEIVREEQESLGAGRILELREKKSEIAAAEKGR